MTLTEYYEDNVKRKREEYRYREYKPGHKVEMGHRHYDFAARIRLRYISICGQLREINERHGDISTMTRPLTIAEWDANLLEIERLQTTREGSVRCVNGDLEMYHDNGWRTIR